jgi:excisionase family DNA binding protein
VSVPPEVEQAIDKRSSMAAVGNLNDYVKFQMAQGMASGQGGAGGFGAEMAVGMAMAQQMMQQPGFAPAAGPPPLPGQASAAPTSTAAASPALLSPAEAAQALGVSEIDVLATLEAGELKGKKIGATWRITRKAIDEFLAS